MQLFNIFCIALFSLYTIFIVWNMIVLLSRKKDSPNLEIYIPTTSITIIIPARNEEQTILTCLQSIASQDFPKSLVQIIVVDDHSTDKTFSIAETFLQNNFTDFKLLQTAGQGKKSALLTAIEHASGKIIITRDADTFTNSNLWLKNIVHHFELQKCDLLISPVILSSDNSFLSTFQQFENLAITSLGAGMTKSDLPFVCSGANLAYKKEAFLQMEPYKDNVETASGDDMFLLKHFYQNDLKIDANTSVEAIARTPSEDSLKKMLFQRLRWASKTGKINTPPVLFTSLLVLLVNTLCLPILVLAFINGFYWWFSLFTLTLKFIIDFLLLFLSAHMYKQKVNWLWFFPSFLFNSLYVPLVALSSIFVKPTWKSRTF
jgi:biofilm PGA synthesis N-glycosyltransferase PgaC